MTVNVAQASCLPGKAFISAATKSRLEACATFAAAHLRSCTHVALKALSSIAQDGVPTHRDAVLGPGIATHSTLQGLPKRSVQPQTYEINEIGEIGPAVLAVSPGMTSL